MGKLKSLLFHIRRNQIQTDPVLYAKRMEELLEKMVKTVEDLEDRVDDLENELDNLRR